MKISELWFLEMSIRDTEETNKLAMAYGAKKKVPIPISKEVNYAKTRAQRALVNAKKFKPVAKSWARTAAKMI